MKDANYLLTLQNTEYKLSDDIFSTTQARFNLRWNEG